MVSMFYMLLFLNKKPGSAVTLHLVLVLNTKNLTRVAMGYFKLVNDKPDGS